MWGRSVTFVFIAVWVGAGTVWIILDWLGNPNRGAFRPAGRRRPRRLRGRLADRARRRAQDDAAVRATLRERYGKSSLRLTWNEDRERRALDADAELVTDPLHMMAPAAEPELSYGPLLFDAEFGEAPTIPEPEPEPENGPEPAPEFDPRSIRGWSIGVHPLALTRAGALPSEATIRSRVWKNLAAEGSWGDDNGGRMRAGKPPRRVSPSTDKVETGRVDLTTARPYWSGETVDTFFEDPTPRST